MKIDYQGAKYYVDDSQTGSFLWAIETTRRGASRTTAGTIDVTASSGTISGASLDMASISPGDLLVPAGGTAPNQKQVTILDVGGSGLDTDPGAGNLLTDYTAWDTETGISLEVFKGNRKTPSGLSGAYTITVDVVQ